MKLIEKIALAIAKKRIRTYIRKVKKMAEQEKKPWYMSRAVIAGIVTMCIGVASAFGIGSVLEGEKEQIVDIVIQGTTIVAGFFAIYGRVKATKKLTK